MVLMEIERVGRVDALQIFQQAYDSLEDGGTLSFKYFDFQVIAAYYLTLPTLDDPNLMEALYNYYPRKWIWDEKSLARELLHIGFYKVIVERGLTCGYFERELVALKFLTI